VQESPLPIDPSSGSKALLSSPSMSARLPCCRSSSTAISAAAVCADTSGLCPAVMPLLLTRPKLPVLRPMLVLKPGMVPVLALSHAALLCCAVPSCRTDVSTGFPPSTCPPAVLCMGCAGVLHGACPAGEAWE
jgi:hypothetical protein